MSTTTVSDRTGRIGSANASTITGDAIYKQQTEVRLQRSILGLDLLEDDAEFESETLEMRAGTLAEPVIAELFAARTGLRIVKAPDDAVRHPKHDFITSHPDYLVPEQRALLECKLVNARAWNQWPDDGDTANLPRYILAQVQHQLACQPEIRMAYVAAMCGTGIRIYEVVRNDAAIAELIGLEVAWWQRHVMDREPCRPKTPQEAGLLWEAPRRRGTPTVASDIERVRRYLLLDAQLAYVTKEHKALKAELADEIGRGGADELWHDGVELLSWRPSTEFDADRFAEEQPEVAEQFARTVYDVSALKKAHPKLHKAYGHPTRWRALRIAKGGRELQTLLTSD